MSAFARILRPLHQAATAFFLHDVALRRDSGGGVRVVLADRTPAGARGLVGTGSLAQLAAQKEHRELALIQDQLAGLLDELPETRRAMRHLAFVEQALGRSGLNALHRLPLDVLQKALEQIEGMVTNWSPAGLASLRSKMAVAIIDREHMDPAAEADAHCTAAVMDNDANDAGLRDAAAAAAAGLGDASCEDAALAAAYAALGAAAPAGPVGHPA